GANEHDECGGRAEHGLAPFQVHSGRISPRLRKCRAEHSTTRDGVDKKADGIPRVRIGSRLGHPANVLCTTALLPKAEVRPRSCYVAFVPIAAICAAANSVSIRSPRRRGRAAPAALRGRVPSPW